MKRLSVGFLFLLSIALAQAFEFTDEAAPAGIRFAPTDGASGRHLLVEFAGQGVALLDYDNDGDLDIYFVNGCRLVEPFGEPAKDALYRNRGDGTFEDVTESSGVGDTGYGLGCAVGDVDNDGWLDLFITNLGRNTLYRNRGDGTFEDVTEKAGVAAPGLNTGCAFADIDRDGDLDLYIARYADYSVEKDIPCTQDGIPVYCRPGVYPGGKDALFRNRGDGTFEDVTESSGVGDVLPSHGLGVATGDVDNDGDSDFYVANDLDPNFLFLNQGDGTFLETGLLAGVAMSALGKAEAGMGTALGDYDNDGDTDIFVTNFQNETNSLYRNDGDGFFTDVSALSGVGEVSFALLGWGAAFADFDNDGWKDLFFVNGHMQDNIARFEPGQSWMQPKILMKNNRNGRFINVVLGANDALRWKTPARGAAFGDLDNDGDMDVVVTNWNQPPNLLINQDGNRRSWLLVETVGTTSNRFGIGARVSVTTGNRTQTATVGNSGSYLSQSDLRLFFGLDEAERIDQLEIRWPSGQTESYTHLPARVLLTVKEGAGISFVPLSSSREASANR